MGKSKKGLFGGIRIEKKLKKAFNIVTAYILYYFGRQFPMLHTPLY